MQQGLPDLLAKILIFREKVCEIAELRQGGTDALGLVPKKFRMQPAHDSLAISDYVAYGGGSSKGSSIFHQDLRKIGAFQYVKDRTALVVAKTLYGAVLLHEFHFYGKCCLRREVIFRGIDGS